MVCAEAWRWRSHVVSQRMSGLSQAVYCRIYGIPLRVFAGWRRRAWADALVPLALVAVARRAG